MTKEQCVVVLDTNVLHDVRLYLSYARANRCYPHQGVEWSETQKEIGGAVKENPVREALFPWWSSALFYAHQRRGN